jgi:hypothetical protein
LFHGALVPWTKVHLLNDGVGPKLVVGVAVRTADGVDADHLVGREQVHVLEVGGRRVDGRPLVVDVLGQQLGRVQGGLSVARLRVRHGGVDPLDLKVVLLIQNRGPHQFSAAPWELVVVGGVRGACIGIRKRRSLHTVPETIFVGGLVLVVPEKNHDQDDDTHPNDDAEHVPPWIFENLAQVCHFVQILINF